MKEKKPAILYSDPVNEIISNPPRKIIRWGTTVIFIVMAVLITLSWIVRYPDVVPAPVEITTVNPPVTLVTKITGRINKLYVTDGEKVSAGEWLAVMETAADISQVRSFKTAIDTISKPEWLSSAAFPHFTRLGELQLYYASFMKSLSDFGIYIQNDFYGNKINSLNDEISGLQDYLNKLKIKEKLLSENLFLERKKFQRDSILFSGNVYSESEIEKSRQSFNLISLEFQQAGLDRSSRMIELAEKRQLLMDYRIKREEEKQKLVSVLEESFMNLNARLKIWENNYLLVSPVEGKVAFTRYWSENQSVVADQPVLNVVPENSGDFVGRILLNMQRSGKVKIGQTVNIKLSGFPYLEYGMVRGAVKTKSLVPSGDAYVIEVTLPEGLTTLYGRELEFTQNMQGTAEILTDDLRLLQKIINPFRYLASKNKI
ncbi:MAG: HlyD family efflux transporter periplasmic adaptor subunit [Bacteroidales bacterium]|jgi:HlyD family secretion protein|nr:HlyD family efflux transporter periplasmic adaptor subunit [Bacteroidales bacterium]